MAMFGWESEKEATKYTKAANRKRLAAAAMRLEDQNENSDCPTELSHREKALSYNILQMVRQDDSYCYP
jgi:hypothetical protein